MMVIRLFGATALIMTAALGQPGSDAAGVTVALNGSVVLHRAGVSYSTAARDQGVQGTVLAEVLLDSKGNVVDASILAGPIELRRSVLQSLLQWHFARDAANSRRQITVQFDLPALPARSAPGNDFVPAVAVLPPAPAGPLGKRIRVVEIHGFPDEAKRDLMAQLPAHVGDLLSEDLASGTARAAKNFDEHLGVGFSESYGEATIEIMAVSALNDLPVLSLPPTQVRADKAVQQSKLTSAPSPTYPEPARQARIQGIVTLAVVVGKDGHVQSMRVISGQPILAAAALEAVKHWVFQPAIVNGAPIEVESEVDVPFTLPAN